MGFLWDSPILNPPVSHIKIFCGVSMGFPPIKASCIPYEVYLWGFYGIPPYLTLLYPL